MMVMFNLIFLGLLLLAATAVVWAIWSLLAAIFARRKAGVILIGLPASVVIVIAGVAAMWIHGTRPATIFANEFGFAPPADVVFVNGYTFALGDSGSTYLHLRANPATIARMAAGARLSPGSTAVQSSDRPTWYAPSGTQHWSRTASGSTPASPGGFAAESAMLTFDPTTGDAWYEFSGVD